MQIIEYARKTKQKLDWRFLLKRAIEAETLQGTMQIDIRYKNEDANKAAPQKLYSVSMGITSKPQARQGFEPGRGDKPRIEDDSETEEPKKDTIDFSEYFGEYPLMQELTEELRKGMKITKKRPERRQFTTVRTKGRTS